MYCTCCLYGTEHNDSDAGKSISSSRAIGRVGLKIETFWTLKIETFLGPEYKRAVQSGFTLYLLPPPPHPTGTK